jgi:hypothetical protein
MTARNHERELLVKRLAAERCPRDEIARQAGMSLRDLQSWAQKLGLMLPYRSRDGRTVAAKHGLSEKVK